MQSPPPQKKRRKKEEDLICFQLDFDYNPQMNPFLGSMDMNGKKISCDI